MTTKNFRIGVKKNHFVDKAHILCATIMEISDEFAADRTAKMKSISPQQFSVK